MAKIHGIAGEWAKVKGAVIGLWPLFVGVFLLGFSIALTISYPLVGVLLTVASLLYVMISLQRGLRHVESYYKGAMGEERVSAILKRLPDEYHVFNDFAVKGEHVDHVVIGPGGVFSIETKFWNGKVTIEDRCILVDGHLPTRPPLAQTVKEAKLVKEALSEVGWSGTVTPVLVFASNTFAARRAEINGAVIMNSDEIIDSFGTNRVAIPPAELDRLISILESR